MLLQAVVRAVFNTVKVTSVPAVFTTVNSGKVTSVEEERIRKALTPSISNPVGRALVNVA
jgi:hypothetical protein